MRSIETLKIVDISTDDLCPIFVSAALLPEDSRGVRRVASGADLTQQDARKRCVFEAHERKAAVFSGKAGTTSIRVPFNELADDAQNPRGLILLSPRQYAQRKSWNARIDRPHHLPAPFDPELPIEWTSANRLGRPEVVWVPAASCWLGYGDAKEQGFPVPDSNGLATGDTLQSAVEYGLLEVIERDAVAIWWYNKLSRPHLSVEPSKLPLMERFVDWVNSNGRTFWLLDLTCDLGVSVAAAITCNRDCRDFSIGFGAGWTNERAAYSAMAELVQFEITKKNLVARKNAPPWHFVSVLSQADQSALSHLFPSRIERKSREERPVTNIDLLLARLSDANLDPAYVIMADDELTTVRVIVPDMRPIWPRLELGRLYDVPVAMGDVFSARAEKDLNAVPILY